MKCPYCNSLDTRVVDSRMTDSNDSIRRRRLCENCGQRFTTYERFEKQPIAVIKTDNTRQPFDRNKILSGLIRACTKRDIGTDTLNSIVDDIEAEIRSLGENEISSKQIGNMVLSRLKSLDKIAYIRFASVYKQFDDINHFTQELSSLDD